MNINNLKFWEKNKAVEQQEKPSERDELINALAPSDHIKWQEEYRINNPEAKDRFRPLANEGADKAWIAEHKGTPQLKREGGEYQVDILNLSFDQLPPSRRVEAVASITVAVDELMYKLRTGESLENFVEEAAKQIHIQWLSRNRARVEAQVRELEGVAGKEEALAEAKMQLLPYEELSEPQKDYDRAAPRKVLEEYTRRHPKTEDPSN